MKMQYYLSIKGTKQGVFKGNSTKPKHINSIEISDFSFGVVSPRDSSSGQTSGKRQHQPLTVTKAVDSASPQLSDACSNREILSEVTVETVSQDSGGGEKIYQRVTLTNAVISAVTTHLPKPHEHRSGLQPPLQDVVINFDDWKYQELAPLDLASSGQRMHKPI